MLYFEEREAVLRRQEQEGRKTRLNVEHARAQFEHVRHRLQQRLAELERERRIVAKPPLVVAGALIVPQLLIDALGDVQDEQQTAHETRRIEAIAMREVMAREAAAGYLVTDVSAHNRGYDVESLDPTDRRLRLIEVKGRDSRGTTITLTRNEQLVAMNKRAAYYLVVVQIDGDRIVGYHEIPDPLGRAGDDGLAFAMAASTFDLTQLLANATT
jgi:hypothetical protein